MKYTAFLILIFININILFSQSDGIFKDYYDSGELKIEGNYLDGKRIGNWISYYKNGQISRNYSYSNGKLDKAQVSYYEDGSIKSKTKKIKEIYILKGFYNNGAIKYERELNDGYYKEYFEGGALKTEATYLGGELSGLWKRYFENGNLEWKVLYKDGYREGNYKQYYRNGDLKLEGLMLKDKKNGEEKRYTTKGILEAKGNYKNDIFVRTWFIYNGNGDIANKIKFKKGQSNKTAYDLTPTKVGSGIYESVPVFPGCGDLLTNRTRKNCMSRKVSKLVVEKFDKNLLSSLGLPSGRYRILVSFKIDKKGNVIDKRAKISHPMLVTETLRVLQFLPKLEPGIQFGEPVIVPYTLPIVFQI